VSIFWLPGKSRVFLLLAGIVVVPLLSACSINHSAQSKTAVAEVELSAPQRTLATPAPAPIMLANAQAPVKPLANPLASTELAGFIDEMVRKHGFDRAELNRLFAQIEKRDDIIAKISRPAERTLAWHEYRAIFLDQARIDGGVKFWREHQATLTRATQRYGVPAEVIVAIIGVETRYGRITGKDPVLEALATLAFEYPRRAAFFRQELEHYLILTRDEGIDPLSLNGSYAGAMGLAQFMPSSYRAYAVDFDGDGRRDLWRNPVDAIGSVANYLAEHRWRPGAPIVTPAEVQGEAYKSLLSDDLKPSRALQQFIQAGVTPSWEVGDPGNAILLELKTKQGMEYWLGFMNFYVITRYNHSRLYAMAAYQLGQAIRRALADSA